MQHLQDNGGQIGPLNFRLGKLRSIEKIAFIVQADTDTWCGSSAPPSALIGTGLRNGFNRQPLHFAAIAVAGNTRHAGINHIADTGNG